MSSLFHFPKSMQSWLWKLDKHSTDEINIWMQTLQRLLWSDSFQVLLTLQCSLFWSLDHNFWTPAASCQQKCYSEYDTASLSASSCSHSHHVGAAALFVEETRLYVVQHFLFWGSTHITSAKCDNVRPKQQYFVQNSICRYRAEKKSLYVVWWSCLLLLLVISAFTCLKTSCNNLQRFF